MKVELLAMNALLDRIRGRDRESFVEGHPGVFLVAMGFLSAEVVGPGRLTGETSALVVGEHLRHDPKGAASHPLAGHAFLLRAGGERNEVVLGRAAECDLTIPDASVSERHCAIRLTERGVAAIDLESRNGTSINLSRLAPGKPELLADEDMLTLGRYSFQVMSSGTFFTALELLDSLASD